MLLTNYKEFGGDSNRSITERFHSQKYEEQDRILSFMKTKGDEISIGGRVTDIINGNTIGNRITKKYGRYVWSSDLEYYVEKYNFRPNEEFINFVLKHS